MGNIFDDILRRATTGEIRQEEQNPESLRRLLKLGAVEFEYYKKPDSKGHSELRNAIGTVDLETAGEFYQNPHGGECIPKKDGYLTYFDLEVCKWRLYHPSRFHRIVKTLSIDEALKEIDARREERARQKAKGYTPAATPEVPEA